MRERRADIGRRQAVAEMSVEEMRRELLVDPLTGLGNRRAYEEAEKMPVQASIDLDSPKWINDNMGHSSGDAMLKAFGEAFGGWSRSAFHLSGDEFVLQAGSEEMARVILDQVAKRLAGARVEVTRPDGTVVSKTGVGFSYGLGGSYEEADVALDATKKSAKHPVSGPDAGQSRPGLGEELQEWLKRQPKGSRISRVMLPPEEKR